MASELRRSFKQKAKAAFEFPFRYTVVLIQFRAECDFYFPFVASLLQHSTLSVNSHVYTVRHISRWYIYIYIYIYIILCKCKSIIGSGLIMKRWFINLNHRSYNMAARRALIDKQLGLYNLVLMSNCNRPMNFSITHWTAHWTPTGLPSLTPYCSAFCFSFSVI